MDVGSPTHGRAGSASAAARSGTPRGTRPRPRGHDSADPRFDATNPQREAPRHSRPPAAPRAPTPVASLSAPAPACGTTPAPRFPTRTAHLDISHSRDPLCAFAPRFDASRRHPSASNCHLEREGVAPQRPRPGARQGAALARSRCRRPPSLPQPPRARNRFLEFKRAVDRMTQSDPPGWPLAGPRTLVWALEFTNKNYLTIEARHGRFMTEAPLT